MKKRLLCVLVAAILLIGVLAGCGDSPSDSSNSDKPGVGSTEPEKLDKGDQTDDDPMEIMEARAKVVNDAVNYTCVALEETVKEGLLFYSLTHAKPVPDEPHDYKPDKPLDYYAWYEMYIGHAEGIVSKDTYIPLLKNERYTRGEVAASDVIETDDLYVYYSPYERSESAGYRPWCYVLVKDTDIVYLFEVGEQWFKADYYENGYYHIENSDSASALPQDAVDLSYTGDDTEYLFTEEFWKAFARTAKFIGNPDNDFKKGECINTTVSSIGSRINGYDENKNEIRVKIPYIEEWYAGGRYGRDAIREGFKAFLENCDEEYGFLVIDDFGQGEPTMFFNNGLYKYAGGGEVTLIHDFSDIDDEWMGMNTDADRTCLLLSAGYYIGDGLKVVDLKTFEITDRVSADYDLDADGYPVFLGGTINGVSVDEETAQNACENWYSTCNIHLLGRGAVEELDFNAAWKEYECRG